MKGKNAMIVQLEAKDWYLLDAIKCNDANNKKAFSKYADKIDPPNKKNTT